MVRWILLFLAGYIIYLMITKRKNTHGVENTSTTSPADSQKTHAATEMSKDPVCGAYVDIDSSVSIRDGDTVHRFCGYECREVFLQRLRDSGRKIPEKKE